MTPEPRWSVCAPLAWELDLALALAFSEVGAQVAPSFLTARDALSADWLAEGRELLRGITGDFFSILGLLAMVWERVDVGDYSALTLELREQTSESLTKAIGPLAQRHDLPLTNADEPAAMLEALFTATNHAAGLPLQMTVEAKSRRLRQCRLAVAALRDGPLHTRFWHWLDRFYYETYAPWRKSRESSINSERARARLALGEPASANAPAPLDWLPPQNPLGRPGPLRERVMSGSHHVVFWAEPFGMFDAVAAVPGALIVTFADPSQLMDSFRQLAEQLSVNLKVIADPSRLTILRMVRELEVDNSDIASYLDVSHPTVSVHIKHLREADLLESRRDGRRLLHRVKRSELERLLRELESFLGVGSR